MGCDGGSIPRREEMVKTKKKQEKVDANTQATAKWFFCALSKRPLAEPIVACPLGKMYNKEAILEYLIDKDVYGDADVICSHVTSLKQLVQLKMTPNPATEDANLKLNVERPLHAPFICPVTMKEMNGNFRFCYLASCGCVFSEQALKEVKDVTGCLVCGKPFDNDDIIPIYSTKPEELERLQERMERMSKKRKRSDTDKKKSKKKEITSSATSNGATINATLPDLNFDPEKMKSSKAIKSLYSSKNDKATVQNPLFNGTFNRYATF